MKIKSNEKGITLIALVVTIIVLLILAGIAISLTIGNNGLLSRAQSAANTWRKAEVNEQTEMSNFESLYDETVNNLGLNEEEIKIIHFTLDGHEISCKEGTRWEEFADTDKLSFDTYFACANHMDTEERHVVWCDFYNDFDGVAQSMPAKTICYNGEKVKLTDKVIDGGVYKRNDISDDAAYTNGAFNYIF